MEIKHDEIIFGLFRHNSGKTEVIFNPTDQNAVTNFIGALSFIAAKDEAFFSLIREIVHNVEKNGAKLRRIARSEEARGSLVNVGGKIKS